MKECYSNELIKLVADETEYPGNSVLAYYITTDNYNKLDRFDEIINNEFFKIYVVDKLKGVNATLADFNYLKKQTEDISTYINWETFKSNFASKFDFINFDKPVFLESYSLKDNIHTTVGLIKIRFEEEEYISAVTMNFVLMKNRVICLAYYNKYTGLELINIAKSKSDYIILRLYDENK